MQRYEYERARFRDEDVRLDEDVQLDGSASPGVDADTEESSLRVRRILILRTELSDAAGAYGKPGSTVRLLREPSFPGDRWQIRVVREDGGYLGCIPFGKNQSAARLMDAGRTITGEISGDAAGVAVYLEIVDRSREV